MIRNELLRLNQIVKSIDINNKEARIQINMILEDYEWQLKEEEKELNRKIEELRNNKEVLEYVKNEIKKEMINND